MTLFEHLDLSVQYESPVFAPPPPYFLGRTLEHGTPDLFRGVLYCFIREIYGPRHIANELKNELLWLQCGFNKPPSRESINRFLVDLSLVCENVFDYFVEQVTDQDLFKNTVRIDSTDVRADLAADEATWNYDPTAKSDDSRGDDEKANAKGEEGTDEREDDDDNNGVFYYGYGCLMVSKGPNSRS